MRLDKFLKISRLVKRRTVAAELCNGGNVLLNKKSAKPSATVNVNDSIEIRFGNRTLSVKVAQVPEKAVPAQMASHLYINLSPET